MKWTTSQLGGRAQRLCFASLLVAGLAHADFIFIGYSGNPPDENTVFFPPSPVVLDRNFSFPSFGSGETVVDSNLGQIKTMFRAAPAPDASGPFIVNAQIDDVAHFRTSGTAVATIGFHVAGFGVLPATDFPFTAFETALARLQLPDGQHAATAQFANKPLGTYTVVAPDTPFPIDLFVSDSFTFSGGLDVPFNFLLSATGIYGASLDLFDTAQVTFALLPGTSVTTDGGFFQSGSTPMPEPSSFSLLATVTLGLLGYRWRQWNQSH